MAASPFSEEEEVWLNAAMEHYTIHTGVHDPNAGPESDRRRE